MKLTLTARLMVGFGSAIFVVLISSVINLYNLQGINHTSSEAAVTADNVADLNNLMFLVWDVRLGAVRLLLDKSDKAAGQLVAARKNAEDGLSALSDTIAPEVNKEFEIYREPTSAYLLKMEELLAASKAGDWAKAQEIRTTQLRPLADNSDKAQDEINKVLVHLKQQKSKQFMNLIELTSLVCIIAGVLTVVVAIIAMFAVLNSIRRPVRTLVTAAQTMSEGDFSFELAPSAVADELGQMTGAFIKMRTSIREQVNRLVTSMRIVGEGDLCERAIKDRSMINEKNEINKICIAFDNLVGTLAELVTAVANAGASVAASSQELSAGADETGKAIQQVAQTMQEVARGSQESTSNVNAAQQSISQTAKAIEGVSRDIDEVAAYAMQASAQGSEGKHSADQAVLIIDHAALSVQQTTKIVYSLGEKTKQIAEFISIITGIADQTNLLALNAAIEAARAGDAGRGFAVVAEEVRKLAEESNGAAGNITKLVRSIEEEMRAALNAMEQSNEEVTSGAKTVGQASAVLSEIVKGVDSLAERVQAISAAAEEINASSTEVLHSMHSMAAVSEENAAASEEVSSATQQQTASMEEIGASANALASLAQELQALVSKFKV
jgi:methyl-accepting chemotaxis protein